MVYFSCIVSFLNHIYYQHQKNLSSLGKFDHNKAQAAAPKAANVAVPTFRNDFSADTAPAVSESVENTVENTISLEL